MLWPCLGFLKYQPPRASAFPVERGFDSVALDYHHDFPSRIPQPVALQEGEHRPLGPVDLLASGHLAAPELQNPDLGMIVLALNVADLEACPCQVFGELDMVEYADHAVLYQESSQLVLARCGLPALWSLGITHEPPRPDSGIASVLAETCGGRMLSGLRRCRRV